MNQTDATVAAFRENAERVSAIVAEVSSPEAAFQYAVDLCEKKEACQLLVSGCDAPLSPKAGDLCETKQAKVMAAPGLDPGDRDRLKALCEERGIVLADDDLRAHLAGIDVGVTVADGAIADTGTLMIGSSSEAVRLATMISEVHIALLPLSRLRATGYDLEADLADRMGSPPDYTAFITGASRTADIERVLTLGVHGPLSLHILLWED